MNFDKEYLWALISLKKAFPDRDLRTVVKTRMEERSFFYAAATILVSLPFHLLMIPMNMRFLDENHASAINTYHMVAAGAIIISPLGIWLWRNFKYPLRHSLLPFLFCTIGIHGFMIAKGNVYSMQETIYLSTIFLSLQLYNLMVFPYYNWMGLVFVALAMVANYYVFIASGHVPFGEMWMLMTLILVPVTTAFNYMDILRAFAAARHEARHLFAVTPSAIAAKSVEQGLSHEDLFRPGDRFCACLHIRWAEHTDNEKQANDYEALQDSLSEAFPAGNHFAQWFGSDLLIVAYIDGDMSEYDLVSQMVNFSRNLLANFGNQIGFSNVAFANASVGFACGIARVGMMGPTGHRRAAILGPIPELAKIRRRFGLLAGPSVKNQPAIFFGTDVLLRMRKAEEVIHLTPAELIPSNMESDYYALVAGAVDEAGGLARRTVKITKSGLDAVEWPQQSLVQVWANRGKQLKELA